MRAWQQQPQYWQQPQWPAPPSLPPALSLVDAVMDNLERSGGLASLVEGAVRAEERARGGFLGHVRLLSLIHI